MWVVSGAAATQTEKGENRGRVEKIAVFCRFNANNSCLLTKKNDVVVSKKYARLHSMRGRVGVAKSVVAHPPLGNRFLLERRAFLTAFSEELLMKVVLQIGGKRRKRQNC